MASPSNVPGATSYPATGFPATNTPAAAAPPPRTGGTLSGVRPSLADEAAVSGGVRAALAGNDDLRSPVQPVRGTHSPPKS
ncbi:MAG: hypothetical protein R3B90_07825 [Planctomycetaceae bacterium]